MHIAILLRGHIRRSTSANSCFNHEFIFNKTLNSFNENILQSIQNIGHSYDIYASVKPSLIDLIDNIDFIKSYPFKEFVFNEGTTQYDDIMIGLQMIRNSEIQYDLIVITRIDFLYKTSFDKLEYKKDKFNFSWREPISDQWICDNMYIFPQEYLEKIINIYENNKSRFGETYFGQCGISQLIIYTLGSDNINFMFNDKYYSGTNWNNIYCDNPLYIIYGYDYAFADIYQ